MAGEYGVNIKLTVTGEERLKAVQRKTDQLNASIEKMKGINLSDITNFQGADGQALKKTKDNITGIGLFSNLPGLANGGRASAGRSYLVGERGPEIFTPKSSGTVIPNNMIGSGGGGDTINNISVTVDASETAVEGDTGQSQALGRQLATAIQTELIKQKRPGGLLA